VRLSAAGRPEAADRQNCYRREKAPTRDTIRGNQLGRAYSICSNCARNSFSGGSTRCTPASAARRLQLRQYLVDRRPDGTQRVILPHPRFRRLAVPFESFWRVCISY
jgi:hypothetical protein